jgi:hypothetical protein
MKARDFTLHFEIPSEATATNNGTPEDIERAFAARQIEILLNFVTLYENGRTIRPDGFSIVNAPDIVHSYPLETPIREVARASKAPREL